MEEQRRAGWEKRWVRFMAARMGRDAGPSKAKSPDSRGYLAIDSRPAALDARS